MAKLERERERGHARTRAHTHARTHARAPVCFFLAMNNFVDLCAPEVITVLVKGGG